MEPGSICLFRPRLGGGLTGIAQRKSRGLMSLRALVRIQLPVLVARNSTVLRRELGARCAFGLTLRSNAPS